MPRPDSPVLPACFSPSVVAMLGRHLLPGDFLILTAYHFPLAQCVVISSYRDSGQQLLEFLGSCILELKKERERETCA